MVDVPPEYCPACGAALTALEQPSAYYCESCEEHVFHNPTPNVRVAVLDGERILLVEIADEARLSDPPYEADSEWMTPGGHPELGEQPAAGAARELEEETGLAVEPGALELFDAVARQVVPGAHSLVLFYAAERSATVGALSAGSDAAAARFWTPAELTDPGSGRTYRDLHAEPAAYREPAGLVARARDALDGSTM